MFSHPVSSEPIQQVCAFNRTVSKVHDFLQNEAKGSKVIGAESLEDMVSKLKKPRRIILLVKAGQAVDDFIDKLVGNFCGQRNCRKQFGGAGWILTGGVLPPGSSSRGRGHHHRRRQLGVQRHNGRSWRNTVSCPVCGRSGHLTQQHVFLFPFPQRRCKSLKEKGLLFVGSGVSGGEEGARYGPSLMPGGNKDAW